MRVWLVGQRSFGAAVLKRLREIVGVDIVGVTAPADDSKLRAAASWSLVTDELSPKWIADLNTDLIVNAHGHAWISKEARAAARLGAIGYHPSLLPRHRGRDAIQWTVAMGDKVSGGTVYQLDDGWDTGPILEQQAITVEDGWSASDLWRKALFPLGVDLLDRVAQRAAAGRRLPDGMKQDESRATYEPLWDRRPSDIGVGTRAGADARV